MAVLPVTARRVFGMQELRTLRHDQGSTVLGEASVQSKGRLKEKALKKVNAARLLESERSR